MRRLSAGGPVVLDADRDARVAPLTASEARSPFEGRRRLDPRAVRPAAEHSDAVSVARIEEAAASLEPSAPAAASSPPGPIGCATPRSVVPRTATCRSAWSTDLWECSICSRQRTSGAPLPGAPPPRHGLASPKPLDRRAAAPLQ